MVEEFGAILRSGTLPTIGTVPSQYSGFKDWIMRGNFIPSMSDRCTLLLSRIRVDDFSVATSFDYERFALSAQETYLFALSARKKIPSLSWPLLNHYYSAFFSAHAIMRSRGAGLSKLDKEQADFLSDSLKIYDPEGKEIKAGMYFFLSQKSDVDRAGEMSVEITLAKDGNGVHDSFWSTFSKYIEAEAEKSALQGQADSASFVEHALTLRNAIGVNSRKASWISTIRNQINYQHDFEAWMPYNKKSRANISMSKIENSTFTQVRLDRSKDSDPIGAFLSTSCYLSKLNMAVAESIAARSQRGGAFGQKWYRLCNILRFE